MNVVNYVRAYQESDKSQYYIEWLKYVAQYDDGNIDKGVHVY